MGLARSPRAGSGLVPKERLGGLGDLFGDRERFARVSSNPSVLPSSIGVEQARGVLRALRVAAHRRFLTDDVSMVDSDVPTMIGHRQVTDAQLLTLARRHDGRLFTFDRGLASLARGDGVELLSRSL